MTRIQLASRAGSVYNLQDFAGDVVGGNWLPVLQTAYNTGRSVYMPEGTYNLDGELVRSAIAPRFFGDGIGRTILRQQGSDALFSQFKDTSGAAIAKRESLTQSVTGDAGANIEPGTSILEFTTTGYAAGDYVLLRSTKLWPVIDEGAVYGEIVRILTVDSATQVTLCGPIDEQYLLADTPTVRRLDLLTGAYFADFTFENPDPDTKNPYAYGIYLNYCLRPKVERVEFLTLDAPAASFKHCVGWRAVNLDFYDLTDNSVSNRYGYGINPGAGSRGGLVVGGRCDGGRHAFTLGATLDEVPVRNTLVLGMKATNMNASAFDTHGQGRYTRFAQCEAYNVRSRAFNNRAIDTTIDGCTAVNCGSALVSDDANSVGLIVSNFEARRCKQIAASGGNGLNLAPPDSRLSNVKLYDCEGVGVVLNAGADRTRGCNVECYRTETSVAAGSRRGIACAANDCSFVDTYGEDVAKVIRYSAATGIDERGTRGRTVTLLRELSGTCTFAQFQHEPLNGEQEIITSTLAFSLTPGTHAKRILMTGAIAADRGVTVQKTNAVAGMSFQIVRTAAATGAFNRNIDNGTAGVLIKALAVGQWCEVVYNGTDWVLAAFGSL